jgi:hypothetical protein
MSLFTSMNVQCPNCNETQNIKAVGSVNADRRPDYRDAILDESFQIVTCSKCATTFRTEPLFNYLEVAKGHWIAAMPARQMPDFLEIEDEVNATFSVSYGENAQTSARDIGKGLNPRLTFGWPAVREKILIESLGLDDVTVELLKLDLLRRLPDAPFAPGIELRVVAGDSDSLSFAWVNSGSEEVIQSFSANRALLDEITGNQAGWAKVRSQLTNGPFVDIQKLYMGEGREAAE